PAALVVVVVPRPRRRKVLLLVLAVAAALWTAGLFVGVLEFLGAMGPRYPWDLPTAVILLGIAGVGPYAVLTIWVFRMAMRPPTASARREGAVFGASASTGAAE